LVNFKQKFHINYILLFLDKKYILFYKILKNLNMEICQILIPVFPVFLNILVRPVHLIKKSFF